MDGFAFEEDWRMSEFSNRISAQRVALAYTNEIRWKGEPLFGLSSKAIERWRISNQLSPSHGLYLLIRQIAAALFFLGNLSQEQVTDEYAVREKAVAALLADIRRQVSEASNS